MKDDDLPEITDQMLSELKTAPVDLHLGPATLKKNSNWWIKEFGPKKPGPGIRAMDGVIAILFLSSLVLIVRAWIWAIFS